MNLKIISRICQDGHSSVMEFIHDRTGRFCQFSGVFMSTQIYAKGSDVYAAFINGAKRKYNRSSDDYTVYEARLTESFNQLIKAVTCREKQRAIIRKTKGHWKYAYMPLNLALLHHHQAGKLVETHARVYLTTDPHTVMDIPMEDWHRMSKKCPFNQK